MLLCGSWSPALSHPIEKEEVTCPLFKIKRESSHSQEFFSSIFLQLRQCELSEGIQRQNQWWNWTSIPGEGVGIFQFSGTGVLWDPLSVGRKKGEAQWALLSGEALCPRGGREVLRLRIGFSLFSLPFTGNSPSTHSSPWWWQVGGIGKHAAVCWLNILGSPQKWSGRWIGLGQKSWGVLMTRLSLLMFSLGATDRFPW